MKENYYDILEINKNASQEIIDKAYKTLVKKYHPDLQDNNLKLKFEEKLKKINEAYEVLSIPEKRKNYDLSLKYDEVSLDDYNSLFNENVNLKNEINYLKSNYPNLENTIKNNNNEINNNFQNNKNIQYNNLKNINDFIALFLTILIILFISFILWHIPFTKNYLINLYNENSALRFIVDLFFNIFK